MPYSQSSMTIELSLCFRLKMNWIKQVRIWTFSGPYFLAVGLQNKYLYSVRMRENKDQKNSEYGHFSRSVNFIDAFDSQNNVSWQYLRKNIFACLFSVHNTISLSSHEQVCLTRLLVIYLFICFSRSRYSFYPTYWNVTLLP